MNIILLVAVTHNTIDIDPKKTNTEHWLYVRGNHKTQSLAGIYHWSIHHQWEFEKIGTSSKSDLTPCFLLF